MDVLKLKRGPETEKSHKERTLSGFYDKYLRGIGLDIGYRGSYSAASPVLPTAIGVDLDYPGYDGIVLPFHSDSQDFIFTSHILEHVKTKNLMATIKEWYRVLKTNGHLIIIVPHKFLYEKRKDLPSRWNQDHQRFYTPASLLAEIESALDVNSYRIRHLIDNDRDYDYNINPSNHSGGCYEIELVLQKIQKPKWELG